MIFVDKVTIYLKSGNGGNGCCSLKREKFNPKGGPDGGNGGKGGDIIFVSDHNLTSLSHLTKSSRYIAQNGQNGMKAKKAGKKAQDLIIKIPIGTQIYIANSKILLHDSKKNDTKFYILKGGRGGVGNAAFKSSTNKTPTTTTKGKEGEELSVDLNLKLYSDIAIVGMPNSGKSTLLASTTGAKTKIASYPFSSLYPMVGSIFYQYKEYIISDTPGLIQGSSQGQGLGEKSLAHIQRAKILLHLLDASKSMRQIMADFMCVEKEIKKYFDQTQIKYKTTIVCLSKSDLISEKKVMQKQALLESKIGNKVFIISQQDIQSMNNLIITVINHIKIKNNL